LRRILSREKTHFSQTSQSSQVVVPCVCQPPLCAWRPLEEKGTAPRFPLKGIEELLVSPPRYAEKQIRTKFSWWVELWFCAALLWASSTQEKLCTPYCTYPQDTTKKPKSIGRKSLHDMSRTIIISLGPTISVPWSDGIHGDSDDEWRARNSMTAPQE